MIISNAKEGSTEIDFYRPLRLQDVDSIMQHSASDALFLAGGMTAMPYLNRREWSTSCIVSLGRVEELQGIHLKDDYIVIGASATHTEIAESHHVNTHCPVLSASARGVGDMQVRNRGTMGGVVAFANSGADYLSVLTAVDALVVLWRAGRRRRIPIRSFITGERATLLERCEVIEAVEISRDETRRAHFLRLTRVQGAPPILTIAGSVCADERVLCIGGATPSPNLLGEELFDADAAAVRRLVLASISSPFGDAHAPGAYRRNMAAEYAVRILKELTDNFKDVLG
ncbi:FAD binding domain-containing protein [Nesterenkonia muleiensis]|uniref:FAD binding domain-containing protein n=1 Tax=Nesterenkonia muleiensis TaxID=2282648 RepID=UPI000E75AD41